MAMIWSNQFEKFVIRWSKEYTHCLSVLTPVSSSDTEHITIKYLNLVVKYHAKIDMKKTKNIISKLSILILF